jgi:hypothetical protein
MRLPRGFRPADNLDDFLTYVSPEPNSGCWLWLGAGHGDGYGAFDDELAHRISLRLHGITIPDGLEPDHTCRVRCCVNPAHLELVTRRINVLRGCGVSAAAAKRNRCPKGHPLTAIIFRKRRPGYPRRICRICKAERDRIYYLRKKGVAA